MLPLKDTRSIGGFPIWTILIIAANIYVFYLQLISLNPDAFITQYALIPSLVDFSNLETLKPFITSQFLHAGFIHIISNMLFLWVFGKNIEALFGMLFPIIYISAGVIGGLFQYFFIPDSLIPMIGASGAVAGILGAYLVFFPHHKIKTLFPLFLFITVVEMPASLMLLYWFFTQLFSGTAAIATSSQSQIGGIAYFAHVGGFVSGYLAALASGINTRRLRQINTFKLRY